MRSLVLLCVLVGVVLGVCQPSRRPSTFAATAASVPAASEAGLTVEATTTAAPKAPLLSLLTLSTALVGAISSRTPNDAQTTLALRLAERTAELEASVARVSQQRREVQ